MAIRLSFPLDHSADQGGFSTRGLRQAHSKCNGIYGFRPSESTREVMKKEDDTGACVWTWHEQAAVFTATVPGGYAGAHNYAIAPEDTDLLLLADA